VQYNLTMNLASSDEIILSRPDGLCQASGMLLYECTCEFLGTSTDEQCVFFKNGNGFDSLSFDYTFTYKF